MRKLLTYDILLQWRQGFWLVYLVVCLIYLAIVMSIPPQGRLLLSILFVLSDTSVLGLTFVGALMLLERQQNVLQSLFVTPLRVDHYLWSKTLSLGLIALVMSTVLLVVPNGYDHWLWARLFVVVTTSVIFTLLGMAFATRAHTLNQYFMNLITGMLAIALPVVPFLISRQFAWLVFFPLNAALEIMFPQRFEAGTLRLLMDAAILLAWCVVALWWARRLMHKNILQKA